LCQEDAYLLELVRYIHLNPLRAGLVQDLSRLDSYPYSGHSALMGSAHHSWQETEGILCLFGKRQDMARQAYRLFVEQGSEQGRRHVLAGGGLIRSAGGWEGLKQKREEGTYQRSDERILGDGDFVHQILSKTEETIKKSHTLRSNGMDLEQVALRVSELMGVKPKDVYTAGKQPHIVNARSLFCFWAVRELGETMASLARNFGLSIPAISKSVVRGRQIAESNGFKLIE
jgi:hypothetical protein